jgi:cellulose synthase/poly-beta-1,6-N-acetylglucosamine synthase-like glycosyltransferase
VKKRAGNKMLELIGIILILVFLFVYGWSIYNFPILVTGIRHLRRSKQKSESPPRNTELPTFSLVVPVKNEEAVIGRLLDALAKLDYPANKKEIIIVEDGSNDGTHDICVHYAQKEENFKFLHKPDSDGKPSALNYGINHARGDIVGVFDADSVPANDALLNVCKYFEDHAVAAVQGRTLSINSEENMLTRLLSYEEAVYYEAYLRGKDLLNLFVYLRGSCQFIRRDVLQKLNGFDENALSEDVEISARLTETGNKIRYAPDVRAWQENPDGLKQLFKQRVRWFRGMMEVAVRYGKLMAKPDRTSIDAEATLFGPFVLIVSLITYFAGFVSIFVSYVTNPLLQILTQSTMFVGTLAILLSGAALFYCSRPRKAAGLAWLPFIYFYWSLQVFIAFYALLLILLRRPRIWTKTNKTGIIANAVLK